MNLHKHQLYFICKNN